MLAINYGCTFAASAICAFGVPYAMLKLYRPLNQPKDKEYKLAMVVRKDIKADLNKPPVLCAHAAELANEQLKIVDPMLYEDCQIYRQIKVVLKADQSSMADAEKKAQSLGLQVTGIKKSDGTTMVLAIGPGPDDLVNEATSELKLY